MLIALLTDTELTVLTGTSGIPARVDSRLSLRLPKGCMRKGLVASPEGFRSAVEGFWKENALPADGVKLVLDSRHFIVRSIDMPIMKKPADQRAYLKRELQSSGRTGEPVFSYHEVSRNAAEHSCRMLVNMIDKASADNIIRAFSLAGITVAALTSPYASVTTYLEKLGPAHKDGTALFLTAGRDRSSSYLFANGGYLYSTVQHLFTEYGSEDFAGELVRGVSNIEQFVQTQHLTEPVRHILLLGFTTQAADTVRAALLAHDPGYQVDDIRTDEFLASGSALETTEIPTLLPGVLAFCDPQDGAGIVESWRDASGLNDGKHTRNALVRALVAPGIALAVCLVAIIALNVWNAGVQGRIDAATDYMANPANEQAIQDYQLAHAANESAHETSDSAGALESALASYPRPGAKIEALLVRCAKGLVNCQTVSYDAATGAYVVDATARNNSKIASFIQRLQAQDEFSDVSYTGYEYNEYTTSAPGKTRGEWSTEVTLTLAPGAGD